MSELMDEALADLGLDKDPNQFKALLSDCAAYMTKSGRLMKLNYPNLLHITCLVHAIHRVCEQVREMFPEVNKFIACMKKIFLKSGSRIHKFKQACPDLPLPPKPVLTRWGTFIVAALYYGENYDQIFE